MTIQTSADKLMEHIASTALKPDTPFAEAVDALKAVTAYLTMRNKRGAEQPADDGDSFDAFKKDLVEDGSTQVAARSRRGN